jgi:hypothetical protein|tara:strand:+ start:527 stop:1039 length:513 start_codon:yes stop_codon:yes gene_type:complete
MVDIKQNILSKIDLYTGTISMPKGFEIDKEVLKKDILTHNIQDCSFPFSKEKDKLNTYLREHIFLEYNFTLIDKKDIGLMFKPNESNFPECENNKVDLRNSPDYVMLYGVDVENTNVRIYYDDNRRAGRSWDINLKNNQFIIFPSTLIYHISNNQKDKLNFILKTTYDFI